MSTRQDTTLVGRTEERVQAAAKLMAQRMKDLRELVGPRGYGQVKLSQLQKALKILPEWWVFGNAVDSVALPWWKDQVDQHGMEETAMLSILAETLYQDPKYGLLASMGQNPDLHALYLFLQQTGLHQGKLRWSWWTETKEKEHARSEATIERLFAKTFTQKEAA